MAVQTVERRRTLDEIQTALLEDADIGRWIIDFTRRIENGIDAAVALREFSDRVLKRYEHYESTPIEIEIERGPWEAA